MLRKTLAISIANLDLGLNPYGMPKNGGFDF
jgi:hypothetical protein